jgi:hypothetical protein
MRIRSRGAAISIETNGGFRITDRTETDTGSATLWREYSLPIETKNMIHMFLKSAAERVATGL